MRLINADALLARFDDEANSLEQHGCDDYVQAGLELARTMLLQAPVADVAEVKRVQWRVKYEKSGKLKYVCPACKYVQRTETWAPLKWNYCPNCGARIGKRRENEQERK